MTMVDYKELGLRVGLEIHRQIESHKLFCHCPSELRDRDPDFTVHRKLTAVASEKGELDDVALFEKGKGKHAVYEGYGDVVCLVELDEEPVHLINCGALKAVLQVCKMLHMKLVDSVQIMRKQVLDYSNTSGFQRTAFIGYDGVLETPQGNVGIQSICIEEDAARKMNAAEHAVTYRLDRLGIPLIEIATAPDMHDPLQVQEVAAHLGMILKSTGKFKGGLGTIRQDVNISITGHPRVELKGVQDLRMIPRIVEEEVTRQMESIRRGKPQSEVRMVKADGTSEFLRPMPGASRMYVETDHPQFSVADLYHDVEVPELLTEKVERLQQKYHLGEVLCRELLEEEKIELFETLVKAYDANQKFVASVLVDMPKEIDARYGKEGAQSSRLTAADFELVLQHYANGDLERGGVFQTLLERARGKVVDVHQYKTISDEKLESELQDIVNKNPGANINALMGDVMKKYRGRVDGKKVMMILQKLMGT